MISRRFWLLLLTSGSLFVSVFAHAGPLHDAALAGNIEQVKRLIAQGEKVNAKVRGRTPLSLAAEAGYATIAELLLTKGAKVNAKTKDGSTPLHWAIQFAPNPVPVVEVLLANDADVNAKTKKPLPA